MSSYQINDCTILQLVEINVGVRLSNSLIAHLTSSCILKSRRGLEPVHKPEMTLCSVCTNGYKSYRSVKSKMSSTNTYDLFLQKFCYYTLKKC